MDLYSDLPPTNSGVVEDYVVAVPPEDPAAAAAVKKTPAKAKIMFAPPNARFKPRQAAVPTAVKITKVASAEPVIPKAMPNALPANAFSISSTPAPASSISAPYSSSVTAPGAPTNVYSEDASVKEEFSSFEVDDPYDPTKPNDYLKWCQERIDRKKMAKLEEDNKLKMEEQEKMRAEMAKERAEAASSGDMDRLQAAFSMGGTGRGRGRGGVNNLPAWMTQSQSSLPTAHNSSSKNDGSVEVGPQLPIGSVANQFDDADSPRSVGPSDVLENKSTAQPPAKKPTLFSSPSCILLLKNMVGPDEVDIKLADETKAECQKYGPVTTCIVHELSGPEYQSTNTEELVRTFVAFDRQEAAVRAFRDLNGRFFGGRQITASFFNEDRFSKRQLAPFPGEI